MNDAFARKLYKFIQHLRGEKVVECLEKLERSQWYPVKKVKKIQWNKIKKIIIHAYNNVPYYRTKFDEHGITPNKIKELNDLKYIPMLTKEELKENSSNLIARDGKYRFSEDSTSGSSGPSTIVFTDRNASAFQHAAVFRAYHWMGLDVGDKLVRFWGTQLDFRRKFKDGIRDLMLNRITFSTHALDKHSMCRYYKKFERFNPRIIYGFTSAIYEFAKFITENELRTNDLNIKAIIATGEPLFSYQRELMGTVFRCSVCNEYGCAEFGPIAYECPEGQLHIMAENVYVEIEENGETLDYGKQGNLVVTELNNFGMPLIRYKLGDVGVLAHNECECGRGLSILKEVSGRAVELIRTPEGHTIHGVSFDYLPKYFSEEIKQFQIIQEDLESLRINVVKDKQFCDETIKKFEQKLRMLVGKRMRLDFAFNQQIHRDKTGKYRFINSKL